MVICVAGSNVLELCLASWSLMLISPAVTSNARDRVFQAASANAILRLVMERIHQPSLLTLLEGIDQRLLVFRRRVAGDDQLDGYSVTQLCAGAAGREINGLELCGCQQRECQNRYDHAGQPECSFHFSLLACVETKLLYPRPRWVRVAGFLGVCNVGRGASVSTKMGAAAE